MTQDQFLMYIRMFLQIVGTFLISKNVFSDTDWTAFAGAIMTISGIGWTLYARRQAGLKQTVAAMPNTVVVTHTDNPVNVANKLAAMPEVKEVTATPEVAAQATSNKVTS